LNTSIAGCLMSLLLSRYEINDWASRGKGRHIFSKLKKALQKMSVEDRALLLYMTAKMGGRKSRTYSCEDISHERTHTRLTPHGRLTLVFYRTRVVSKA